MPVSNFQVRLKQELNPTSSTAKGVVKTFLEAAEVDYLKPEDVLAGLVSALRTDNTSEEALSSFNRSLHSAMVAARKGSFLPPSKSFRAEGVGFSGHMGVARFTTSEGFYLWLLFVADASYSDLTGRIRQDCVRFQGAAISTYNFEAKKTEFLFQTNFNSGLDFELIEERGSGVFSTIHIQANANIHKVGYYVYG